MSLTGMVGATALTGGLVLTGRWVLRRRDELGRPRDFPVWSVSLLALLAVVATIPGARRHGEEQKLSGVASALVGHRVAVRCQAIGQALADMGNELGWVKYDGAGRPEPRTLIKRDPCRELRGYYSGHQARPSLDAVVAVHVLTHESMHMRGLTVEAEAECAAMQRDETTAQLLGATPAQARELARVYWEVVYPRMPDNYRSRDCAAGEALDEGLATAPWSP